MQISWKDHIPDATVTSIAQEIDNNGYAFIPNFISEQELVLLRAFAEASVQASGGRSVDLNSQDSLTGTLLGELPHSVEFKVFADVFRKLLQADRHPLLIFTR